MGLLTIKDAINDIVNLCQRQPKPNFLVLCVFPEESSMCIFNFLYRIHDLLHLEIEDFSVHDEKYIKGDNFEIRFITEVHEMDMTEPTHIYVYMGDYYSGVLDKVSSLYNPPFNHISFFYGG